MWPYTNRFIFWFLETITFRARFFLDFSWLTIGLFVTKMLLYSPIGWLEPLMSRIGLNWTTVVTPVIDVIMDDTLEYTYSSFVAVGGFDWNLQVEFTCHGTSMLNIYFELMRAISWMSTLIFLKQNLARTIIAIEFYVGNGLIL